MSATRGRPRTYYRSAFGFRLAAYRGPETGDARSRILRAGAEQDPLGIDHAAHARTIRLPTISGVHGDGVHDIALWVDDAEAAWRETTRRGARSMREPETLRDDQWRSAPCRDRHLWRHHPHLRRTCELSAARSCRAFAQWKATISSRGLLGLQHIDHMVGNVGWGEMNRWVDFYRDVMGFRLFQHFDDKDISTEYSALMSKVMSNGNERVKFPINEPAQGKRKSQIEEYLEFYHGPGVQHIAWPPSDIIDTVSSCGGRAWNSCACPRPITMTCMARIGPIDEPVDALRDLGILVDRDDEGYMLQIFTRPVEDRPTLFFEVIQRKGQPQFRQRQLQGAVRGDRARTGAPRKSVKEDYVSTQERQVRTAGARRLSRKAPTRRSTGARASTARARISITRIRPPAGSGLKASCGRTASI